MATVSHTIYSRYDPQERKTLEHETGQLDGIDLNAAWESNVYLGPQHRRRRPPHFIPATKPLDDWGSKLSGNNFRGNTYSEISSTGSNLSVWYRSLTSNTEAKPFLATMPESSKVDTPRKTSFKTGEKRNKNNWFIMKVLQFEEASPSSPSRSLADIIARDPPPVPTEERYKPPVWIEIGPSNKGFQMLQRSGWNEGEALGPDVIRRPHLPQGHMFKLDLESNNREKGREALIKHEVVESKSRGHKDVCELRKVDVIDLTLSDSDPEEGEEDPRPVPDISKVDHENPIAAAYMPKCTPHSISSPTHTFTHRRTALLTPIATVLKSDRLGIGLQAKTVGPFKASQKRITHNAAALAAHIRAAKESQKRKQLLGRGRRGFAKRQKGEELERKRLLEYLNN